VHEIDIGSAAAATFAVYFPHAQRVLEQEQRVKEELPTVIVVLLMLL
jgi:hypothetical protein